METLGNSQGDLGDTGKGVTSPRRPKSRVGTQSGAGLGLAGRREGPFARHLAVSCFPPQPQPGESALSVGFGAPGISWSESVRGGPFPLHQVLNLALGRDPPGQHLVLLPAGQPPCRAKVVGDGRLEVGQG